MPVFSKLLLGPDTYLDLTAGRVVHRFQCCLADTVETYLEEARAAGVDLDSNSPSQDLTSLDAFDEGPVGSCVEKAEPPCPKAAAAAAPFEGGQPVPPPSKKRKLFLAPGSGEGWSAVAAPRPASLAEATSPSSQTLASPQVAQKKNKGKRRGKNSSRPRGGKALKDAEGNKYAADTQRLQTKLISKGDFHQTSFYSVEQNGSRVSTGWQGRNPPPRARAEIRRLYGTKAMQGFLEEFYPVYANQERPTFLVDSDSRIFLYRTGELSWMRESVVPFHEAVKKLLGDSLSCKQLKTKHAHGERGPHFPCIIGHHRQYTKKPTLTGWHTNNFSRVEAFLQDPIVEKYIQTASNIVQLIFPGVAKRFIDSAAWHDKHQKIQPFFGLFWNFCINGLFPGQRRVHCLPHADSKNIVGVCILAIYVIPGFHFNHSKRSWLVLWEAGVVIELPPWTMVAYPSALLYHFNIDITDFKFVTTDGNVRPTPENSTPIVPGDDEGRVSLVFFNQASMHRLSELDGDSVVEAKRKGRSATRNYAEDVQKAFQSTTTYIPFSN